MSKGCDRVAFTHHVRDAQTRYGSRATSARLERRRLSAPLARGVGGVASCGAGWANQAS
jgi:hypothetical protein